MKVGIVRVGNSRGIRIPKPILEQCGFHDTVELQIENHRLVIARARRPREGWEEAFRAAGPSAHDELFLDAPANQFRSGGVAVAFDLCIQRVGDIKKQCNNPQIPA